MSDSVMLTKAKALAIRIVNLHKYLRGKRESTMSKQDPSLIPSSNLVKNMKITAIDQALCSDITYIYTEEGFVYLSLVMHRILEHWMSIPAICCRRRHSQPQSDGVRCHIRRLTAQGRLKRIGGTKGGRWEVVKGA